MMWKSGPISGSGPGARKLVSSGMRAAASIRLSAGGSASALLADLRHAGGDGGTEHRLARPDQFLLGSNRARLGGLRFGCRQFHLDPFAGEIQRAGGALVGAQGEVDDGGVEQVV